MKFFKQVRRVVVMVRRVVVTRCCLQSTHLAVIRRQWWGWAQGQRRSGRKSFCRRVNVLPNTRWKGRLRWNFFIIVCGLSLYSANARGYVWACKIKTACLFSMIFGSEDMFATRAVHCRLYFVRPSSLNKITARPKRLRFHTHTCFPSSMYRWGMKSINRYLESNQRILLASISYFIYI